MSAFEWDVQLDEEFRVWLEGLDESLQDHILSRANSLRTSGPHLGRPYVDTVKGSVFANMKELRIKFRNEPWRILFAFDPEQSAILLLGGNKQGDKRWYKKNIPIAEARFRRHLKQLEE